MVVGRWCGARNGVAAIGTASEVLVSRAPSEVQAWISHGNFGTLALLAVQAMELALLASAPSEDALGFAPSEDARVLVLLVLSHRNPGWPD
jgi:hypothetical protein